MLRLRDVTGLVSEEEEPSQSITANSMQVFA